MRRLLPITITLIFQLVYIGLLKNVFLNVIGVEAIAIEPVDVNVVKRSIWNNLVQRGGSWPGFELVSRQTSSGNRTEDLYDFFKPNEPPVNCTLQCELIWGAVSACDLRSCLCTEQYGHEFERCVTCLAPNPTSTQVDYYQGILDEFQGEYCANYGIPPLSFSASGTAGGPTAANAPIASSRTTTTTTTTSSIAVATGGGDGDVGYITASSTPTRTPQFTNGAISILPRVVIATMVVVGIIGFELW